MLSNRLSKKNRAGLLAGLGLLLLVLVLSGCTGFQKMLQNPRYIYENGAVLVDGADSPIELKNNPQAINVTLATLKDFLHQDTTDLLPYVERENPEHLRPFVCSDFAETVHNNAEAAGIRAGYVSIDWSDGGIGHAINCFQTTDEGLIFIDCTGQSQYSQVEQNDGIVTLGSWDKVAYVLDGRRYGVISLAYALSGDYSFYLRFEDRWQALKDKLAAYNEEVKLYNQQISNHVFIEGSADLARIKAWEASLDQKEQQINELSLEVGYSRFRPLAIVSNYEIHW